jgi:hypothetical protein
MPRPRDLFDIFADAEALPPTDPNVDPQDVERLSRQCAAILERLRRGPATNVELVRIALNHTARISDLRKHGHDIRVTKRNAEGVFWYGLYVNGELVNGGGE